MEPTKKWKVDAYPDAYFAGLYGHEKPTDPTCTKSRTGLFINISDCPVVCMFKLQRETALLTMEVEINVLSRCCRELFPVMGIVKKVENGVGLPTEDLTSMYVSVHEDNAGALILAETIPPHFTPRINYYAIKTVSFREENIRQGLKMHKINTLEQLGDNFTKGLQTPQFENLRKEMMGW